MMTKAFTPPTLRKFPAALSSARLAASLSQKQVSVMSGIDQSLVCALERGRKKSPNLAILDRLIAVMRPESSIEANLRWSAVHDSVIEICAASGTGAVELVSRALMASKVLSKDESVGLARLIERVIDSKGQLAQLNSATSQQKQALLEGNTM